MASKRKNLEPGMHQKDQKVLDQISDPQEREKVAKRLRKRRKKLTKEQALGNVGRMLRPPEVAAGTAKNADGLREDGPSSLLWSTTKTKRWLYLLGLSEAAMKKGNANAAKRIAVIMEREGVIPPARMREQLRQEYAFSATMGASTDAIVAEATRAHASNSPKTSNPKTMQEILSKHVSKDTLAAASLQSPKPKDKTKTTKKKRKKKKKKKKKAKIKKKKKRKRKKRKRVVTSSSSNSSASDSDSDILLGTATKEGEEGGHPILHRKPHKLWGMGMGMQ